MPEVYYQRRRVAAAVVLLIAVGLILWLMVSLGGSKKDNPESTAASSPQTTSSAAASESEKPTSSSAAPSSEPALASGEKKKSCELSDLVIKASSRPDIGPEDKAILYFEVSNPTAADCEVDLSTDIMKFEIFTLKNYERVWSDVDCNRPMLEGKHVFPAEKNEILEAEWSKTSSAPGKCQNREPAAPGAYSLFASIGSNVSPEATFNLK